MLKFFAFPLLLLLLTAAGETQEESTFTSRSNLVEVPTLVLDQDGKIVEGLHADDFVLEDDGVPQKLQLEDNPDVQPISLMIAVQCGRRAAREYKRISTLGSMLDPVLTGPDTEAAILLFDSKLNLVQDSALILNAVKAR